MPYPDTQFPQISEEALTTDYDDEEDSDDELVGRSIAREMRRSELAGQYAPQEPANPYAGTPRIFNQWKPGTYVEQSDPPISPEQALAMTESRLGTAMLSTAEQQKLGRLQNGAAAVQGDIAAGRITPQAGQMAMGLIQQQMGPLMVRRSQIPMYLARARYQRLQMQTAQQAALAQETERFNAQTAQQRVQTVQMPDGSTVSLLADRQGHLTVLNDVATRVQAQQGQRQQSLDNAAQSRYDRMHREALTEVRRERERYDEARRTDTSASAPDWYNRFGQDSQARYSPQAAEAEARRRAESRFGGPSPAMARQAQELPSAPASAPANAPAPPPANGQPSRQQQLQELTALFSAVANPPRASARPAPAVVQTPPPPDNPGFGSY